MDTEEKEICRLISAKARALAIMMLEEIGTTHSNKDGAILYGLGEIKAMAASVTGDYDSLLKEEE